MADKDTSDRKLYADHFMEYTSAHGFPDVIQTLEFICFFSQFLLKKYKIEFMTNSMTFHQTNVWNLLVFLVDWHYIGILGFVLFTVLCSFNSFFQKNENLKSWSYSSEAFIYFSASDWRIFPIPSENYSKHGNPYKCIVPSCHNMPC